MYLDYWTIEQIEYNHLHIIVSADKKEGVYLCKNRPARFLSPEAKKHADQLNRLLPSESKNEQLVPGLNSIEFTIEPLDPSYKTQANR